MLVCLGLQHVSNKSFVPPESSHLIDHFMTPDKYDITIDDALSHNFDNKEGYVVITESGFRMKIKFKDYVKLHAVMTELTSRHIWEALRDDNFHKILEIVPDEMYDWVHKVHEEIMNDYKKIEDAATKEFESLYREEETRKQNALAFVESKYENILFAMMDNKQWAIEKEIWKLIKPKRKLFKDG